MLIVSVKGKNITCHRIHYIFVGRFKDYILKEISRKTSVIRQEFLKPCKFRFLRKLSEQKQIYGFLKSESVIFGESVYQLFHIYSAVSEFSGNRNGLSVFDSRSVYRGNLGKSGKYSSSVRFTQSSLYLVNIIKFRIYYIVIRAILRKSVYLS